MGWQGKVRLDAIFVAVHLVVSLFTYSSSRGDVKHALITERRDLRRRSWVGSIDHIAIELIAYSSESNNMLHSLFSEGASS